MNKLNKLQDLKTTLTQKQRIILLVVAVVVVLGALTATVFRDNAASFLRWMTYSQKDDDFPHNAQSNSLFLGMGDDLLICTQTQIQLVSPTGTARLKETVNMSSPALNASGDYAGVYDVGGQELNVYISDAVVTPDCRGVYLISPGQAEGAFENTLLYYTLSSREEPTRTISLGSNVVLSIRSAGRCWILGDKSLLILDSSGVITSSYDYDDQYLKMGSLQGNGFATLFLSTSSSGTAGTLVTVGTDGKPYGELALDGQTLALAAQGHKVAVLTTSEVISADRKLDSYTTSPNQRGVRNLAVYEDGSVALINSAAVSLYFPSNGTKVDPKADSSEGTS